MSATNSLATLALLLTVGGCAGPSVVPLPTSFDGSVWGRCESEEGRQKLAQAESAIAAGNSQRAVELLRDVARLCPKLVRAHRLYQDQARRLGGAALGEMQAFYGGLPEIPFRPEVAWFKGRLIPSAYLRAEAMKALLKRDQTFAPAHFTLAQIDRAEGGAFLVKAEASYQRVLSIDPNHLEARRQLAELQVELGKLKDARRHYENVVRGRPTDRSARRALVRLLLYEDADAGAAEPHVEELLRLEPDDPDVLMDLGALRWQQGRYDEAAAAYRQVLDREPRPRAVLNLANLYYDVLGRDDASRRKHWPVAQRAYLRYQKMAAESDALDTFDQMFAVPARLAAIDTLIGKYPDGEPPRATDL